MTINPRDLEEVDYDAEATVTDLEALATNLKMSEQPTITKKRGRDDLVDPTLATASKPKEADRKHKDKTHGDKDKTHNRDRRKSKPRKDEKITVKDQQVAPVTMTTVTEQSQNMITKKAPSEKSVPIVISMGSKKGHKFEQNITIDQAYHIERNPGRTLKLRRGRLYKLTFKGKKDGSFKLMFTDSPLGGPTAKPLKGTPIIDIGTDQEFSFPTDTPQVIYYQDVKYQFIGGMIIIADS
jgi:hypothetical protein